MAKGKFRALRGKDANKFFAFKNATRRKSFRSIDVFLKILYRLAFTIFVISVAAIGVGIVVWLMSYVFIIGFTIPFDENPGIKILSFSFIAIPWALIGVVVIYLVKFITEWAFLLAERRELKKNTDQNKNYLAVGSAIFRIKFAGMLAMAVTIGLLVALSFMVKQDMQAWQFALLIIPIVAYVINKIYSTRRLIKVQPQIEEIKNEREQEKQAGVGGRT